MPGEGPEDRDEERGKACLATLLVHRRLDEVRSGSGVYLLGLIDQLRAARFDVRIVMSPVAGFGSLPFSHPARIFRDKGCLLVWPSTIRLGPVFVSTSRDVWRRALNRGVALARWNLLGRRRSVRPTFQSSLGRTPGAAELDLLAAAAGEVELTMVVAEYSSLAPVLSRCPTKVRAVLLHDLFSFRTESFREAGLPPDHVAVSLETELGWLDEADSLSLRFGRRGGADGPAASR